MVVPHSRCTKGASGVPLMLSEVVGSLTSQIPVSGWHLKNRSSSPRPSGVMDAIVPDLDHATVLQQRKSHHRTKRGVTCPYLQLPRLRSCASRCTSCLLWPSAGNDRGTASPKRSSTLSRSTFMALSRISGIFSAVIEAGAIPRLSNLFHPKRQFPKPLSARRFKFASCHPVSHASEGVSSRASGRKQRVVGGQLWLEVSGYGAITCSTGR